MQPRMVQLGAVLCDTKGREIQALNTLITPDGWQVDYDSEQVHGWTTEDCAFLGIPAAEAMAAFADMCARADVVGAHHLAFDRRILEIEAAFHPEAKMPEFRKGICTMIRSASLVGIPYGDGYKRPSLVEAVNALTDDEIDDDDLHDGFQDARYCMKVMLELDNLGVLEDAP
ncbi:Exonuclease [Salipiger mucosus DSM 16094]|uniref:Exonuclease n=1 Tax=Salipiger mucosus DSM 16094 TaxID=1123237 RepID=S9S1A8_9RHOB|nr:Exonuclease [Salipiger mucosus DSM 16094]